MQEIARREIPRKEIAFHRILLKNKLNPERIIHIIGQVHRPPGMGTNNPYVEQYMPYQYAIYGLVNRIHTKLKELGEKGIDVIIPEGFWNGCAEQKILEENPRTLLERIQDGARTFALVNGILLGGIETENTDVLEHLEFGMQAEDGFMGGMHFIDAVEYRSGELFKEIIKRGERNIVWVTGRGHLKDLEELRWKHMDQIEDAGIIVYTPEIMDV
ncbi:hypothetical protein KAW38_03805 [Candidatus Micrarchaeota archaeon]|nr:hypothetical protein [Candidatus Micrarchaeota archaeon]